MDLNELRLVRTWVHVQECACVHICTMYIPVCMCECGHLKGMNSHTHIPACSYIRLCNWCLYLIRHVHTCTYKYLCVCVYILQSLQDRAVMYKSEVGAPLLGTVGCGEAARQTACLPVCCSALALGKPDVLRAGASSPRPGLKTARGPIEKAQVTGQRLGSWGS